MFARSAKPKSASDRRSQLKAEQVERQAALARIFPPGLAAESRHKWLLAEEERKRNVLIEKQRSARLHAMANGMAPASNGTWRPDEKSIVKKRPAPAKSRKRSKAA